MTEIYSNDIYTEYQADIPTVTVQEVLGYGSKAELMDWILTLYLVALAALESTVYFKASTYLAYFVFASFFINLLLTFSTNRSYGQVFKITGFWLLLGFLFWCLCVALMAEPRTRLMAFLGTWYITKIHLVALIFMIRCDSFNKFFLYLKALVVGAMVVAVSGAVLGYSVAEGSSGSQLGMTDHSNAFGISLFVGFISSIILLPVVTKKWKLFIWGYFIATFVSLLISASRGSFVACGMAFIVYFGIEHVRHLKSNLKIILPVICIMIFIPFIAIKIFPYSPLVLKMTGLVYGESGSTNGRLEIYEKAWSMFLSDPLKGIGVGTFKAYSQFVYTHTTIMEILVTVGLIGFVLYYGFYLHIWIMLSRLKKIYVKNEGIRKVLNACRAVLLSTTVYGAFTVVIYQKGTTFIIAMMLGLAFRMYFQVKSYQQDMFFEYNELNS